MFSQKLLTVLGYYNLVSYWCHIAFSSQSSRWVPISCCSSLNKGSEWKWFKAHFINVYRVVKVGRDLLRLCSPTSEQGQLERVAQGHQVLKVSGDGDSTVPMGNLFHFSITLRVKKKFLMFRWNFLYVLHKGQFLCTTGHFKQSGI